MAATYKAIATATVTSGGSIIEFTNIPSTYTDLAIKISARDYSGNQTILTRINNDGGGNYSRIWVYGEGVNAVSAGKTSTAPHFGWYTTGSPDTANTFANIEMYISNYTSSNYKPILVDSAGENNATAALAVLASGTWNSSSVVTSVQIGISYGLAANSTATLYGIKSS